MGRWYREGTYVVNSETRLALDLSVTAFSLIYHVKGVDAGRNAWYFTFVRPESLTAFKRCLNDDIIHLEDHGVILSSAYGESGRGKTVGCLNF